MKTIDLTGKTALVTGSSGGIGRAAAIMLAECGASVAVHYLNSREQGEEVVAAIRAAGGQARLFRADAAQAPEVERLIDEVVQAFGGPIDILVNNAGHLIRRCPAAEVTEELYDQVMDVNLRSTVFACKAVIPGMKEKGGGVIVNMASLAAHNGGGPGSALYAASKAAVLTYTKALAKEVAGFGIRANSVAPGFIGNTAFHSTFTPEAARNATIASVPLAREGVPEDVANAIVYLASDMSGYLTGETIEINGGLFMK